MKKSILILGAGLMQRPAIESAKSLGLKVFLIDANPNALCVPLADEFRKIDLKSKEEIASYAIELKQKENLICIFTAGTDFSASVSYASEKAGILSHSFQASLNASDKTLMRECFEKSKVPSPKFIKISQENKNEILNNFLQSKNQNENLNFKNENFKNQIQTETLKNEFFNSVNFPLVVKPVDNMGARGCRMIRNLDELNFSVDEAIKYSRSKNCILEEYMEGPEYSIDALVYDGTMTITGFADRHIFYKPYFIEMGHTMPTSLLPTSTQYEQLITTFARGVKALGLTCGAAKADIKFTKNGAMIGEIAARLSGGYMSGWTFPYSSDLNLTKAAIQIACGKKPVELENLREKIIFSDSQNLPFELFNVPSKKCSSERAWISIPGIVKKIHGLEKMPISIPLDFSKSNSKIENSTVENFKIEISNSQNLQTENLKNENSLTEKNQLIKNIFPRILEGDKVVFPRNNVEKCGNVISQSSDKKIAIDSCEEIIKNITLELEPNNLETTQFLTGKKLPFEKDFPPNAFNFSEKIVEDLKTEIDLIYQNSNSSENKNKEILQNQSVKNFIPQILLKEEILKTRDWNYLTLEEVLTKFDELKPNHKNIDYKNFWLYVIYGSIQGALYAADSE